MPFSPLPGGWYYLVAVHSGKVLEVKDRSQDNGAVIQQADAKSYDDSFHQQFAFNVNSERVYVLRARHSQKVIDVQAASGDDGATVHQWDWHGVDHERVHILDAGDATCYVEFLHSGKVLEIYGEEKDAGKPAKQFRNHYNGKNLHQRFRPVLADEGLTPDRLPGFTNPSQIMRDVTLGIAGLIPEAGGAIKGLVSLLWPDQNASMIFKQVLRYIDAYVENKLQQERINALRDTITGAQIDLREFVALAPGPEKASKLTATITSLNIADRPFFRATAPEQTISYLVTIGTIKLTLLQEQARNYAKIAGIATDTNQAAHYVSLRDGISEYTRAAQSFAREALNARVARIGDDTGMIDVSPGYHQFTFDVILRDAADGQETMLRVGPTGGWSEAEAKGRLKKAREDTVRAQLSAQLDAVLAPGRLWRSFDPEQTRPGTNKIRASVGPYGTVRAAVDMAGGTDTEIGKIEVWADNQVHGLRVTNRQGASNMVGDANGTRYELDLAPGEFVAAAYGSAYHYVHSLFLETTFGRRLSAGQRHVAYRFYADLPSELKPRLGGITASSGNNAVSSIQFHWDYVLEGEFPVKALGDEELLEPSAVSSISPAGTTARTREASRR